MTEYILFFYCTNYKPEILDVLPFLIYFPHFPSSHKTIMA